MLVHGCGFITEPEHRVPDAQAVASWDTADLGIKGPPRRIPGSLLRLMEEQFPSTSLFYWLDGSSHPKGLRWFEGLVLSWWDPLGKIRTCGLVEAGLSLRAALRFQKTHMIPS